jgi:hypothetical protein
MTFLKCKSDHFIPSLEPPMCPLSLGGKSLSCSTEASGIYNLSTSMTESVLLSFYSYSVTLFQKMTSSFLPQGLSMLVPLPGKPVLQLFIHHKDSTQMSPLHRDLCNLKIIPFTSYHFSWYCPTSFFSLALMLYDVILVFSSLFPSYQEVGRPKSSSTLTLMFPSIYLDSASHQLASREIFVE